MWKAVDFVRKLVGCVAIAAAIPVALYLAIWVCFVGGIVELIDGIKATPTDGGMVAFGLIKAFILPETVGSIAVVVCVAIGIVFLSYKPSWFTRS